MKVVSILILLVTSIHADSCPLWFYNDTEGTCVCGNDLKGIVHCDPHTGKVSLQFFHCMTYSPLQNETIVGPCLLTCPDIQSNSNCHALNVLKSNSTKQITEEMCGELHREGQLCGNCILKFTSVTFIPLTVFYFIVILFKISVTSGHMVAYVLSCQIVTNPGLLRAITIADHNRLVMSIFSIWNLDAFRSLYNPFCIHPNMSTLAVLALDYLVGIYPLFMIFVTYIAVMICDRFPQATKRVYWLCTRLKKDWNIRSSLVQAFVTFLILSYVKILNISFDLLTPVYLKNISGNRLNRTYLFIDADVEYFGSEHLPYAILALVMLTMFNILPMLWLLLHPCKCFHICLNKLGVNCLVATIFIDVFQGSYRYHPRDCRYFAGLYLMVRVIFLITTALIKFPECIVFYGVYAAIMAGAVALFEPYKEKIHNKIDISFFLVLICAAILGVSYIYLHPVEPQFPVKKIFNVLLTFIVGSIFLYGAAAVLIPKKLLLRVITGMSQLTRNAMEYFQKPQERSLYRFEEEHLPLLHE